jgi:hypothetical protein
MIIFMMHVIIIITITIIDFFIFEFYDLYYLGLGFISSLPQFYLGLKALLLLWNSVGSHARLVTRG